MRPSRNIRWSALTCRLHETDIYLGLAASLDDIVSELVSARRMVAFPLQSILMTAADAAATPLRVLAVRDPELLSVDPAPPGTPAPEPGFQRVTLELKIPETALVAVVGGPSAAQAKATLPVAERPDERTLTRPVMAFLLTVGLPTEEEDAFFMNVVRDFLSKSWMTLPSLLRQVGCTSAEHVAEGECDSCRPDPT